jgi:hypothetical protein
MELDMSGKSRLAKVARFLRVSSTARPVEKAVSSLPPKPGGARE